MDLLMRSQGLHHLDLSGLQLYRLLGQGLRKRHRSTGSYPLSRRSRYQLAQHVQYL